MTTSITQADLERAMNKTDLERARRLAEIVKTIPAHWADSERWPLVKLEQVAGFIECRYRVNTPDRFFIVRTASAGLSFDMLERSGIQHATDFALVAVRSLIGESFPDITTDDGAAEIMRLNRMFVESSESCGATVEAIFTKGNCNRTGREFRFEDWIDGKESPETQISDCHPLSPLKEKWPGEEYARNAIIRLRESPELQKNVSAFCRTIAEEQGVPEVATSLKKLLYEPEYKPLWKS